jgi:hypothetical protein
VLKAFEFLRGSQAVKSFNTENTEGAEKIYERDGMESSERSLATWRSGGGTSVFLRSQGLSTRLHHIIVPVKNKTAGTSPITVQVIFTEMPANRPKCSCASQ